MKFSDFSLKYKLLTTYLVIVIIVALFGGYLLYSLNGLKKSFRTFSQRDNQLSQYLELELYNRKLNLAVRNFILTQDPAEEKDYDENLSGFDIVLENLLSQDINPKEKQALIDIDDLDDKIKGVEL